MQIRRIVTVLFIVASQPMFLGVIEGVQGCGHVKSADLAPGTGLEEQNEISYYTVQQICCSI